MTGAAQVQKIIPIGLRVGYHDRLGYLMARAAVQDRGGLPSHVLLDEVLVKLWPGLSETERDRLRAYFPARAREVLVHPAQGEQFRKGKDVIDIYNGDARFKNGVDRLCKYTYKEFKNGDVNRIEDPCRIMNWVFAGTDIPEAALGKPKVGLFVDPEDVSIEQYRGKNAVIVHPASIIVVDGLVDTFNGCGQVHEATRLPVEVAPEVLSSLPDGLKRWLHLEEGPGVRPLVRYVNDSGNDGSYTIVASDGFGGDFGVAFVGSGAAAPTLSELLANAARGDPEALQEIFAQLSGPEREAVLRALAGAGREVRPTAVTTPSAAPAAPAADKEAPRFTGLLEID